MTDHTAQAAVLAALTAAFGAEVLPGDDSLPSQSSGLEVKLEFLQKLAMSDTDRVAEVLRQWITSNERIDNK